MKSRHKLPRTCCWNLQSYQYSLVASMSDAATMITGIQQHIILQGSATPSILIAAAAHWVPLCCCGVCLPVCLSLSAIYKLVYSMPRSDNTYSHSITKCEFCKPQNYLIYQHHIGLCACDGWPMHHQPCPLISCTTYDCQCDCNSHNKLIAAGFDAHLCLIVPLDNKVINQCQALGDQ